MTNEKEVVKINAVILGINSNFYERLLLFINIVRIRKRSIFSKNEQINLYYITKADKSVKIYKKLKKVLIKDEIKSILFEENFNDEFIFNFKNDFNVLNYKSAKFDYFKDSIKNLFNLYGIKKGKLRLAIQADKYDEVFNEFFELVKDYLKYLIILTEKVDAAQECADKIYKEQGIPAMARNKIKSDDCDALFLLNEENFMYPSDLKFIVNLTKKKLNTKIKTLCDFKIDLPKEIETLYVEHSCAALLFEEKPKIKGFIWQNA